MAEYKSTHPSEKDPDRPKKPLTAYMLFTNSKRAEIKQAHPGSDRLEVPLLDYSITDVSKEIGKLWKEVSEEEKEVDIVFLFHCRLWRNSIGRQK